MKDFCVGDKAVAADWAGVVFEDGSGDVGKLALVDLVVELIELGVDLVEVDLVLLAKLMGPFLVDNVPGIVSSGEKFGQF